MLEKLREDFTMAELWVLCVVGAVVLIVVGLVCRRCRKKLRASQKRICYRLETILEIYMMGRIAIKRGVAASATRLCHVGESLSHPSSSAV